MKKGDIVWNTYHGLLRVGKVTKRFFKESDPKWGYINVKWYNDEAYEKRMDWREKLSGEDHTLDDYRADQLHTISSERLKQIVKEIEEDK